MRARTCALVLALLAAACGEPAWREAGTALEPDVAALVNGRPISRAALIEHARTTRQPPRAALRALVRERLLADHAVARGYDRLASVRIGVDRARVRALLAVAVEDEVPPSDVDGRARRLEALLTELRRQTAVRFDSQGVARAVATAPRP